MKRYRVRYRPEAKAALREAFVYIAEDDGSGRAGTWLKKMYEGIDALQTAPRSTRSEGTFDGWEFRSKLVITHRVFFTIDDAVETVYVIDIVHTARQTKLDEYEGNR